VREDEQEVELRDRVQQGEYMIYPQAIGWCAAGRAQFDDGRALLDGKPLDAPVVIDETC